MSSCFVWWQGCYILTDQWGKRGKFRNSRQNKNFGKKTHDILLIVEVCWKIFASIKGVIFIFAPLGISCWNNIHYTLYSIQPCMTVIQSDYNLPRTWPGRGRGWPACSWWCCPSRTSRSRSCSWRWSLPEQQQRYLHFSSIIRSLYMIH